MIKNQKILTAVAAFISKMGGVGFTFLFTILVARQQGAEQLGSFMLCYSVVFLVSLVARIGLDTAVLKTISQYLVNNQAAQAQKAVYSGLVIVGFFSILFSILVYGLASVLATLVFHNTVLIVHLQHIAPSVVGLSLTFYLSEIYRAYSKPIVFALLQHFLLFAVATVLYYFAFSEAVYGSSLAFSISSLSICTIALLGLFFLQPLRQGHGVVPWLGWFQAQKLFKLGTPMLISGSMLFIMGWSDTFMLGMYLPESQVGIYNAALKLASLISLPLLAVNAYTAPEFARLHALNHVSELEKTGQEATKYVFIGATAVWVGLVLTGKWLLGFYGQGFVQAYYLLLLVSVGQLINSFSGSIGYLMQMTGHEKQFRTIIIAGAVINVLFNLFLIPPLGLVGAAIGSIIGFAVWNISSAIVIKKSLGVYIFYPPFYKLKHRCKSKR